MGVEPAIPVTSRPKEGHKHHVAAIDVGKGVCLSFLKRQIACHTLVYEIYGFWTLTKSITVSALHRKEANLGLSTDGAFGGLCPLDILRRNV